MPYKNPEKKIENDRNYRETHKDELREYFIKYHEEHRGSRIAAMNARYYRTKAAYTNREYELRLYAMDLLGGRFCKKCGFDDIRALQFDHVNGYGGNSGRRKNGTTLYKQAIANPEMFQILCANCNWIKRYENHEVNQYVYGDGNKETREAVS